MKKTVLAIVCLTIACTAAHAGDAAPGDYLNWTRLPDLPDAPEAAQRLGRAGMFAGVHNDALILAGGANFPTDRLKGGEKTTHDDIFVLVRAGEDDADAPAEMNADGSAIKDAPKYKWIRPKTTLAAPLAYGAAVAAEAGLVCIGGEGEDRIVSWGDGAGGQDLVLTYPSVGVFVLAWDAKSGVVTRSDRYVTAADREAGRADKVLPLPDLPEACAHMAAAKVGEVIYVAGGNNFVSTDHDLAPSPPTVITDSSVAETRLRHAAMKTFWSLDLSKRTDVKAFKWKQLDPWPGPARMMALAAAQNDGQNDCFYLFSGKSVEAGVVGTAGVTPLTDAYRYRPKDRTWLKLPDVGAGPDAPCVAAGAAAAFGEHHVLLFGGGMFATKTDESRKAYVAKMKVLSDLEIRAAAEENQPAKDDLERQVRELKVELDKAHPGFQRSVWAFHTLTKTWTRLKDMPMSTPPVTTTAVRWGNDIVMPSGEIRPGVRTPVIWRIAPKKHEASFGWVNWSVMGAYLAALLVMGFYFSKREKTTEDFFLGGRRIPWWAAGLSIYGTMLSAITFMAIPATTYQTNWLRLLDNWMIIPTCALVAILIVPFYARLRVTTAYEYLERRFNVVLRLYGSVMFILMQIGRIGIVILLPALTLKLVTGIDVYTAIAIMGVLCTIYTVMGGIEAVIWTDVLQVVVLLGGGIVSLVIITFSVPDGLSGIVSTGMADSKMDMTLLSWDYTELALWVVLLGAPLSTMVPYTTDQTVVQRYLTTSDVKQARRSLLTTCVIVGPASLMFFGIGTALFAFYKASPHLINPTVTAEAIFPFFILQNLPAGVAGLVIAAVFAASMSSLDSSMNSIATAVTTDWYRRFKAHTTDRRCLALARWITVIVGVVGTAMAIVMASSGQVKDLWKLFSSIFGLLGGGLLGVFLLGMFTRRATSIGALIGAIAGAMAQTLTVYHTKVNFLLYAGIGAVTCIIVGYLVSLATGPGTKDLAGLTIHTQQKDDS